MLKLWTVKTKTGIPYGRAFASCWESLKPKDSKLDYWEILCLVYRLVQQKLVDNFSPCDRNHMYIQCNHSVCYYVPSRSG